MKITITANVVAGGKGVPSKLFEQVMENLQAEIEGLSFSIEKNEEGDELDCSLEDVEISIK